jgi:excinuclease ABC subunit C
VYLYKNAEGEVIYVGKAKNLRARVRSYLLEASQANAKTGSLMREAVDLDYILVANEHEALALENNLIKQRKPRFNILLRDDKTYPYVKLTLADRFPKVFVTRRLRKDGVGLLRALLSRQSGLSRGRADSSQLSAAKLQGRSVAVSSARLPAVLHSSLPGAVRRGAHDAGAYAQAVRDAQLFLEGRPGGAGADAYARMMAAA